MEGKFIPQCLQVGIANYQAMLSKYDTLQWAILSDFKNKIPVEITNEFRSICEEGHLIAKTALQVALDTADTGVCPGARAITMKCVCIRFA